MGGGWGGLIERGTYYLPFSEKRELIREEGGLFERGLNRGFTVYHNVPENIIHTCTVIERQRLVGIEKGQHVLSY